MKALNGGQQDLLPAGERIDEPPQWFRDALDNAPQDHFVAYRQTNLHYRQWHTECEYVLCQQHIECRDSKHHNQQQRSRQLNNWNSHRSC